MVDQAGFCQLFIVSIPACIFAIISERAQLCWCSIEISDYMYVYITLGLDITINGTYVTLGPRMPKKSLLRNSLSNYNYRLTMLLLCSICLQKLAWSPTSRDELSRSQNQKKQLLSTSITHAHNMIASSKRAELTTLSARKFTRGLLKASMLP